MKNFIFSCTVICILLAACERDDICAETTPTTPLLVIDFYDADNTALLKAPTNLAITPLDEEATAVAIINTTTVSLPLKTDDDTVSYSFTNNSLSENDQNSDELTFNYTRTEDFVSSACGYRIIYDNLEFAQETGQDGSWIQDIDVLNTIIDNDTITHVTIFH